MNIYFVKLFYKLQLASEPYHFYQYTVKCPQPQGQSLRREPLCRYMWSVNWRPTSRTSWGWRIQTAQTFPRLCRGLVRYQDNLNKTKIVNGSKLLTLRPDRIWVQHHDLKVKKCFENVYCMQIVKVSIIYVYGKGLITSKFNGKMKKKQPKNPT